jgi:hypothetical protein
LEIDYSRRIYQNYPAVYISAIRKTLMKKYAALLIMSVVFLFCSSCVALQKTASSQQPERVLENDSEATKPAWVSGKIPQSETFLYWRGISNEWHSSEQDASNEAMAHARRQVLEYYGQYIQENSSEKQTFNGVSNATLVGWIEKEQEIVSSANGLVSQVYTEEYYPERWFNTKTRKTEFKVFVLGRIPKAVAASYIDNFSKSISEKYAVHAQGTIYDSMQVYTNALNALRENNLHHAIAYHERDDGVKESLALYLQNQINTLANSTSFEQIPSLSIQNGEKFSARILLNSDSINLIGAFKCVALLLNDKQVTLQRFNYEINSDNSFPFSIDTNGLEVNRKYTVSFQLPFNQASSYTNRTSTMDFTIEVLPIRAGVKFLNVDNETLLRSALQNSLRNAGLPDLLGTPPDNTKNNYDFVITLGTPLTRNLGMDSEYLVQTISIDFQLNDSSLEETHFNLTGKNVQWLQADYANKITEQIEYFDKLKNIISGGVHERF